MSYDEGTIEINHVLDEEDVSDVIVQELQRYIRLLIEFLSDPEHYEEEERQETLESIVHLKAVLEMYMGRSEYKEFLEEIEA